MLKLNLEVLTLFVIGRIVITVNATNAIIVPKVIRIDPKNKKTENITTTVVNTGKNRTFFCPESETLSFTFFLACHVFQIDSRLHNEDKVREI